MNLYFTLSSFFVFFCAFVTSQETVLLDSSDFKAVVKSPSFVDKSLLIKTLTERGRCSIVTAPPKFGKSLAIDMVKRFFDVEVDQSLNPTVDLNSTDPPSETMNYKVFSDHNLKIMEDEEIVNSEFGKTPVITVNFRQEFPHDVPVKCMYDAVKRCKQIVHASFKQHEYLVNSVKLSDDHVQYVKLWCDEHSFKTKIDTLYVSHGLPGLAQYLHQHFRRKVYILVDDHDHLVRSAAQYVRRESELRDVARYVAGILRDLVKDTEGFVRGVVITGVTNNPYVNDSYFDMCSKFEFLGNHAFAEYFGFSEQEVGELFSKSEFNLDAKEVEIANAHYRGYQSKSPVRRPVYNIFSVLNFLKTNKVKRYYTGSEFLQYPVSLLEIDSVQKDVDRLLQDGSLDIDIPVNITVSDLVTIKEMLLAPMDGIDLGWNPLYVLLEWGFFAYVPRDQRSVEVMNTKKATIKVPNDETKEYFINKIIAGI